MRTSALQALKAAERYRQAGDMNRAQAAYEKALKIDPSFVDARLDLAALFLERGAPERAMTMVRPYAVKAPTDARAQLIHAVAQANSGQIVEAVQTVAALQRHYPNDSKILIYLGELLMRVSQPAHALEAFRAAGEIAPSFAVSDRIIEACRQQKDINGAIAETNKALARFPAHRDNLSARLDYYKRLAADWDALDSGFEHIRRCIAQNPEVLSPFRLLPTPATAAEQLRVAQAFCRASGLLSSAAAPARGTSKRISIGYLSSDFHSHPIAALIVEIIELHSRDRFMVHGFSCGPDDGSPMSARLRAAFDQFHDLSGLNDDRAAALIRSLGVDILIDLGGLTYGSRIAIAARRPAPIQMIWLAHPGTSGADFIDYIVADAVTIPPELDACYSEKALRLPWYQPNDRRRVSSEPLPREQYGLPASGTVFCSFNQTFKFNPDIFADWAHILNCVPGSVLWLLQDSPEVCANLRRNAGQAGFDPERLIFGPRLPGPDHFARYRVADLLLDTFPYGSHMTGSDALWMGCPMVTRVGETFAARIAASLLQAVGLPELVTTTRQDYVRLATELGNDSARLEGLRRHLTENRGSLPLFDTPRMVAALESEFIRLARG